MWQRRRAYDGQKLRILLVEDNPDLLRVESHLLQRNRGWVVLAAGQEYRDASSYTSDLKPQVVVLDLDRPAADGLETILHLRNVLPGVGIIGLTLSNGSAYRQAALAAGADDVVCKADMVQDLPPAIQRVGRQRPSRRRRMRLAERWLRRRVGRPLGPYVSGRRLGA